MYKEIAAYVGMSESNQHVIQKTSGSVSSIPHTSIGIPSATAAPGARHSSLCGSCFVQTQWLVKDWSKGWDFEKQ